MRDLHKEISELIDEVEADRRSQEPVVIRLTWLIEERTYYTGAADVDLADFEKWTGGLALEALQDPMPVLREYMDMRGMEHDELDGDVQGQEWRDLEVME